jgi:hypothetical protein
VLENPAPILARDAGTRPEDIAGGHHAQYGHIRTKGGALACISRLRLASTLVLGTLAQIARMAHFDELPKPAIAMVDDLWDLLSRGIGA